MKRNPFTAGRWVCGSQFFGRSHLIQDILRSNEFCEWIIGKRRIGKTSLLRQLESLTNQSDTQALAIFWDIQGSFDRSGMSESLYDAIEDSRDQYPEHWESLPFDFSHELQCHQNLKNLCRMLNRHDMKMMLLIDEAEEFLNIGKSYPESLGMLRKLFQNTSNLHTVLCSTARLEHLHLQIPFETSPFLHGFSARYLGHFSKSETLDLLAQGFDDRAFCEEIFTLTEGNPFQSQLLAKNAFEEPDIERVAFELETNPALLQVLEVNFDLLSADEQDTLKDVYRGKSSLAKFSDFKSQASITKLTKMGYLTQMPGDKLSVCSHFLRKWLGSKFDSSPSFHSHHKNDERLAEKHKIEILKQVPTLYKFFLEVAIEGNQVEPIDNAFRISTIDGSIYPDRSRVAYQKLSTQGEAWRVAIDETARFLSTYLQPDETWTLHRFLTMAQTEDASYSENEFLDLLLLMAGEAELS